MAERGDLRGPGAGGFSKAYWDANYDAPMTMDGIYNAREQARYFKAVLDSEFVMVESLVALGFGLGYLFQSCLNEFMPAVAVGIEPSPHAFHEASRRHLSPAPSTELTLMPMDLLGWCEAPSEVQIFDVGICSSVFQYLTDPELQAVLPVMARRIKYLYFSVPTDVELRHQARYLDLDDGYAFSRTREEYRQLLGEHFTIISRRVLESKAHFDFQNSDFNDHLFRF